MVVGYADMLKKAGPLDTGDVAALKQKHQCLPCDCCVLNERHRMSDFRNPDGSERVLATTLIHDVLLSKH